MPVKNVMLSLKVSGEKINEVCVCACGSELVKMAYINLKEIGHHSGVHQL